MSHGPQSAGTPSPFPLHRKCHARIDLRACPHTHAYTIPALTRILSSHASSRKLRLAPSFQLASAESQILPTHMHSYTRTHRTHVHSSYTYRQPLVHNALLTSPHQSRVVCQKGTCGHVWDRTLWTSGCSQQKQTKTTSLTYKPPRGSLQYLRPEQGKVSVEGTSKVGPAYLIPRICL